MKTLLTICLLMIAGQVGATNYYLANSSQARAGLYYDANADNSNNGTTSSTPWETLKYAVGQLSPGDTLYIMGGLYNDTMKVVGTREIGSPLVAAVFMLSGGTSGNPIVFKSYTDRDSLTSVPMAEIQCHNGTPNDNEWGAGFLFEDADYITIDSIHIDSCSVGGVYFFTCDYITVKNCVIHDIWGYYDTGEELNCGGIFPNGSDGNPGDTNHAALIYNNTIYDIRIANGDIGQGDNSNGIHGRGLRSSIIRGNTIYEATFGMRLKSKMKWNLVDSNYVYNSYEAGICLGPGAEKDTIRFNVYWQGSGDGAGIMLQDNDGYLQLDSNLIYNNTVIGGGQARAGISIGDYSSVGTIDSTFVFNNIAMNFDDGGGAYYDELFKQFSDPEIIIDYNCYYDSTDADVVHYPPSGNHQTLAEWQALSTTPEYDDNSVNVDPEFLNLTPGNENFLRLDTVNTPAALLTGGRGGLWPTYMGAYDPYAGGVTGGTSATGATSRTGKTE